MGLLDGLLGGVVGAEMVTLVQGFIEKQGGVQAMVGKFEQQGMGSTIKSWIGQGENQPISPEEIQKVLGSETVQHLAEKFGVSPDKVVSTLSALLPKAVDQMTPEGKIAA